MDQFEFIKEIYEIMLEEIESRNDEDYVVNPVQMAKLVQAYQFFAEIAKRDGGSVDPFDITPRMVHSGITAYFPLFYLTGKDLRELAEIVGDMSALTLEATIDGEVCISFNIPNVFRLKESK